MSSHAAHPRRDPASPAHQQSHWFPAQPPNPFPVAPSLQITRQAPEDDPFNTEILLPESQEIEIIIEFPDGFERPLTRTSLYVYGVLMDENTAEPFNTFNWDRKSYTLSGEHQLTVEAVDVLGLSKTSMPLPVLVTVIKPPSGPAAFLAKYRTQLTFGAIMLAGLVLFAILLSGRLRFLSLRAMQEERRVQTDPLTQSIAAPLYFENILSGWQPAGEVVGPPIRVLAFDPQSPPLMLDDVRRLAPLLTAPDTVLFDEESKSDYVNLQVGDTAELNGRRVTVVGRVKLGTDFADDGTIFCSDRTFNAAFTTTR